MKLLQRKLINLYWFRSNQLIKSIKPNIRRRFKSPDMLITNEIAFHWIFSRSQTPFQLNQKLKNYAIQIRCWFQLCIRQKAPEGTKPLAKIMPTTTTTRRREDVVSKPADGFRIKTIQSINRITVSFSKYFHV